MKTQNIDRTAYPDGTTIKYIFGMPKPKVQCYGDLIKQAILNEVQNLPKTGGVCFEDEQEALLDVAKELITPNAKRR